MTPSEINRRVAEACGLRVEYDQWDDELRYSEEWLAAAEGNPVEKGAFSDLTHLAFDPYHDANDALWAAERVGVAFWGSREEALMAFQLSGAKGEDGQLEWCAHVGDSRHVAFGDTPSAAICNAILALAGVTANG